MKALLQNCATIPQKNVITFVDDQGRDAGHHTFRSLSVEAQTIASYLRNEAGLGRGERVLMIYTPSLEFVSALAACLLAGLVPVPICPPDPFNLKREVPRLNAIIADCEPALILCNREYNRLRKVGSLGAMLRRTSLAWPRLQWLETDRLLKRPVSFTDAPPGADDIAVLQYTSGSTGAPKGVMITHANVEHQCECNRRQLDLSPEARAVFWVPHYHDFGLISGIMSAFYGNAHLYLMSPLTFINRPTLWFDVMSRVAATHTASPNFGYELIISKSTPEQRRRWNLESLRVAMSAAEPINPDTVRRFKETFAVSGFAAEAFCPAYGLAEHTVGVTVAGKLQASFDVARLEGECIAVPAGDAKANATRELIGCGVPDGVDVRIVDPESGGELAAGQLGEIWVDSPSKAAGYWGQVELSEERFQAPIAGTATAARYLRTGDTGFLWQGELFVIGRRSDVIIIRGRNLYPQDIEASVIGLDTSFRPGGTAAVPLTVKSDLSDDDVEGLLLIIELRHKKGKKAHPYSATMLEQLREKILGEVASTHQVSVDRLLLCLPGALLKTTSGKLRRRQSRDRLLAPDTDVEAKILLDWRRDPGGPARPSRDEPVSNEPEWPPLAIMKEPRIDVDTLDAGYRALIARLGHRFGQMGRFREGRLFHPVATTLWGTLHVLPLELPGKAGSADTPSVFVSGRQFPVLLRHANGVTKDDASWDNRGATLRLLDPARPEDLERSVLDLLLTTGSRFTSSTADDFCRWMGMTQAQKEALAETRPDIADAAWDLFRLPEAYNACHYYTKTATTYLSASGQLFLARYRLVNPDAPEDSGKVERSATLPPEQAGRLPGETRDESFLHTRLKADIGRGPIRYRLQVQLRPQPSMQEESDVAHDALREWPEPWQDRAELKLTAILAPERVENLAFNPANAPEELGLVPAVTASSPASLNHLRAIIYAITAAQRVGAPLPSAVAELLPDDVSAREQEASVETPYDVVVVGAGVSGLTAARDLERRGYRVLVLEKLDEPGGKARSIQIDGHTFDLGAHLCSNGYRELLGLLEELDIPTEPVSQVTLWSIDRGVRSMRADGQVRREFLEYQRLKQTRFPALTRPGFTEDSELLLATAANFFQDHALDQLGTVTALGYTASGYGYFDNEELSAHQVLKYAESATFCMPGEQLEFQTPRGGFGPVWRRIASELKHVVYNAEITAIARGSDGVCVEAGGMSYRGKYLLMACQPPHLLQRMDLSAPDRELFAQVQTIGYITLVARASGLPQDGFYLVEDHLSSSASRGHTVAFHHRYPDSDVYLFWAYADIDATDGEILAPIEADVQRMGGCLTNIHRVYRWSYLPHFGRAAANEGAYRRLEALQGQQRTYWAGSLFNFELVENNMQYASHIAERLHTERLSVEAPRGVSAKMCTGRADPAFFVDFLVGHLARVLDQPRSTFQKDHHLLDLGLDSVKSVAIFDEIREQLGIALAPMAIYEYPTIARLAEHLCALSAGGESANAPVRTMPAAGMPEAGTPAAGMPEAGMPEAGMPDAGYDPHRSLFSQLQRCRDIASRTAVLQGFVAGLLAEALAFDPDSIGPGLDFRGAGLNSVQSIDIFDRVMEQARIQLPPMVLYEYPTLGAFSRFLAEQFATFHPPETAMAAQPQTEAVADSPALAELLTRMTRVESTLLEMSRQLAGQPPAAPVTPSVASDSDEVSGVSKRVGEDAGPWLRIHRAAGVATRLRLVCFHSAGLDARMYDAWAALLPASVELVAVELPGRGQHPGKPIETMQALLPAIAAALETRLSAPYVLFGHSFGALVAYAFCRYQCARGGPRPARLMIASFWAPDEFVIRPELTRMMANKAPPGLASDQKIMDSWVYQPGEGLPLPITVFHGARDMMVPQEKIFGWRKQSSVAVDLHILEGGHFQLTTDPALQMTARALLALHLAPAATGTALTVEAGARSDVGDERLERLMAAHDAEFGSAADTRGSWNLWDLNHLARARAEADDGEGSAGPAFQEALNTLLQLLRPEGHYGRLRSPYPYCNLALAITTLNTLLCWHDGGEHDYAVYFDGLQRQILETDRQRKRDIFRGVELPFGRYFKFPGMFGESMVPELEGALLLRLGREILLPEVVQLLQAVAGQFSEARVERYFRFGEFALPFPESYPEAVIRSPRLEAFAQGALPELPGFSTAFAARYFDVTRSLETRAALDRTLRDADLMRNLRPAGKLQEVYFALNFLNKSGIDLKTWYPKGLRYLRETQQPYGVGIDELALDVDVDSTAIAMIVMQEQGLEPVIEQGAKVLERKWSEEQGSYRSTLGYFFNLNMLVLAVRATLLDRNAPADLKRTLCQRLSDHLTGRQWISVDHVSPFYLWESVLSLLCEFHQQFSADTLAHVPALLELILPMQQADGGFRSYLFAESDIEETGLAVLALKSALRGPLEPAADATLRDSIRRAERFLLAHLEVIADPDHHFPEQWIGTLLFSPPKIVRAIVLASLLKAPMAVGQGEGISRLCR